ncbi:hypothetical protein TVAG_209250 [Trichomonas vaginalis G3]|uniref:Uncharacterized protein n=3 Tax=Trichomonas vaginalis (strain ATCC PRA-98 / G3) TaxID=412133 RepID=A2DVG7_TRIV3|nr:hypothetical protein TVAG_209250 [Trichomonas vaginalis G3]|eukprot:XP_001327869.1 hypothetical protein [Trichomonas vaginalis G3]
MSQKEESQSKSKSSKSDASEAANSNASGPQSRIETEINSEYYEEEEVKEAESYAQKKSFKQKKPPLSDMDSSDNIIFMNQKSEDDSEHSSPGTSVEDPKFIPQPPSLAPSSSSSTAPSSPKEINPKSSFSSSASRPHPIAQSEEKSEVSESQSISLQSVHSMKPKSSVNKYSVPESSSSSDSSENADSDDNHEFEIESPPPAKKVIDSRSIKSTASNGSRKLNAQQVMKFKDPIKELSDEEDEEKKKAKQDKSKKSPIKGPKINYRMKFAQDRDVSEIEEPRKRSKFLLDESDDDYQPPKKIGGEFDSSTVDFCNRVRAPDKSESLSSKKSKSESSGIYTFNKPKDLFASDDESSSKSSKKPLNKHKFLNEDDRTPYHSKKMTNEQKLKKKLADARGDNRKYLKDEDLDFLDQQKVKVIYVSPKKQEESKESSSNHQEEEPSYEEEDIQEPSQSKSSTLDTEHKEIMQPKSPFLQRDFSSQLDSEPEVFRRKNRHRIPQRKVIRVVETDDQAYERMLLEKVSNRQIPSITGTYYERTMKGRIENYESESELERKEKLRLEQEEEERKRLEAEKLKEQKRKIRLGILSSSTEDQPAEENENVKERDVEIIQDNLSQISEDSSVVRRREELMKMNLDSTSSSSTISSYKREGVRKGVFLEDSDDDNGKRRWYPNYEDDPIEDSRIYRYTQKKAIKIVKQDFNENESSTSKSIKSKSKSKSSAKNKYSVASDSD